MAMGWPARFFRLTERLLRESSWRSEQALLITASLCLSVSENLSPTSFRALFSAYPFVSSSEKSARAERRAAIACGANNFASCGCGPLCVLLSGIMTGPESSVGVCFARPVLVMQVCARREVMSKTN